MKKVININFQGRVVVIEEDAYENLKKYIESLRKHFVDEEGADEIINDIENRISELFVEVIKKGNPCVSEADLEAIIHSIGRPEDFEDEENTTTIPSQTTASENQSKQAFQQTVNTSKHRQFFRDENNKKLGGVCAGIANYFNIDVTWVRLFALVLLVFYGVGFIPYVILWIAVPSSATQVIGSNHKRLYRDLTHKTIGGVCAGLANYFNISIWIPKVIFLVGTVVSLPIAVSINRAGGFLFPGVNGFFVALYIILWSVVPAAVTASEKLSMKGETVDLNSIKNTVQEDLNDNKRSKKKNNPTMVTNASPELIPVKERSTLGDIIVTLFKVFAYFILGCILLAVICALGAIGVVAFGIFPFKDYLIGGTWQNTLLTLTIILFVWLPVIGIIIWIIRSLMKTRPNKYLRMSMWILWIVGLMSFIGLVLSIHNGIKEVNNPITQNIHISNPKVSTLNINYERLERPFRFSRYWIFGNSNYSAVNMGIKRGNLIFDNSIPSVEDSIMINNTDIQFTQSTNDSFGVYITKLSNGRSVQNANDLAAHIHYNNITQQDSVLNIPSYFGLNKEDKFRNQFVLITIAVPIGKKIIVHRNDGCSNKVFLGFMSITNYDNPFDMHGYHWDYDEEYMMTKEGLKSTPIDEDDIDDDVNNVSDNIKFTQDSIDAAKRHIEKQQKILDEEKEHLKKMNEEKKQNLEKQLQKLKQDSGKSATINMKFESPLILIGKAFLKIM